MSGHGCGVRVGGVSSRGRASANGLCRGRRRDHGRELATVSLLV